VLAPFLLVLLPAQARRRFLLRAASAAIIAVLLVSPFLISQAHTVAARGVGFPIALQPYRAFQGAGWLANLLAFWPLVLPFNFPALFPAGALALRGAPRQRTLILVLACCAGACLTVTWLLRSTIENNDLGWRAPIPAILVLTAFAATVWSRWLLAPRRWPIAAAGLLAALGLVQAAEKFDEALHGQQPADAAGFARSEALWEAVRRVAGPDDRVGNNPLMLADLTPWPDDISWALLSNRPSCYGGWASAIAYAGVSRASLAGIDALFQRVFAGHPEPGDVAALATRFDCRVIVLTPADGAWLHDPFAGSTPYRLAAELEGRWRIYRRATPRRRRARAARAPPARRICSGAGARREEQKFFGSFFQKRTACFLPLQRARVRYGNRMEKPCAAGASLPLPARPRWPVRRQPGRPCALVP
jgi:hypothetical protein